MNTLAEDTKETIAPNNTQTTEENRLSKKDKTEAGSQSNNSDSATGVNLTLKSPRITCSFKCDRKLWEAFVSYSKANYGSVCHLLESILRVVIASEVYQSRTIKPIVIENLNIERVVKRVRRISPDDSVETFEHKEFKISVERSREQARLESDDSLFGRVIDQWSIHSDMKWKKMWVRRARERGDAVPNAKLLRDLAQREGVLSE